MASPFPGMDPYLEGELWQEFHGRLANQISEQLLPLLTPKYTALLASRFVIGAGLSIAEMTLHRNIYPDVPIVQTRKLRGVATMWDAAAIFTPPTLEVSEDEKVPQLTVEIRDVAQRRLVTVIEILSPANKMGRGYEEYQERRERILGTETHLLEIDLLRRGLRPVVSYDLPNAPYFVFLNRADRRYATSVWAVGLPERLPIVPVPLLHPDPDVPLDLQAAVEACFALVHYEQLLDYTVPPPLPELDDAAATWLQQTLQAAGRR